MTASGRKSRARWCKILEASGFTPEWESFSAGAEAVKEHGTTLPQPLLDSIARNKIALKGPITTPIGKGFTSVNVGLRKALDLYANLRPVWNLPSVQSRYTGVDLVIVRENTEDLYAGLEHTVVPGVVESLKIITDKASTRIAEFAFEQARRRGRKKVTAVHKANIMKLSDGLFLDCARKVAARYPDIEFDDRIVDAACMHLVMHPERLDVLLLPNLYGDIVSDLCAGLVGGLGVVPAANLGENGVGVFEAVHGTAPDIAGRDIANPTALLLSAVLMLQHLHEDQKADAIVGALKKVLASGHVTPDLGGSATTTSFADAICRELNLGDTVRLSRTSHSMPPDTIAEAVLAREDVARFLEGSHGLTSAAARTKVLAYLDELQTTQRYELYRALEYPLYPILRKIERVGENQQLAVDAVKKGRVVYASNHRSHIDYLVEPLVLDDAGIRPPIIAAGINLFGGPLGLIHKHVTGALPIRRNTKDPAYLITLKAYVSELLHKHDLFFYPEGGRSYSGELKPMKAGLLNACLDARHHAA